MAEIRCEECGSIIPNGAKACPNCGCPIEQQTETTAQDMPQSQQDDSYKTVSELFWSCEFYKVFRGSKFDLAQRIYEVGALWWETITVWWKCFTKKIRNIQWPRNKTRILFLCQLWHR